jgi:hypothetical protein
MIQRASHSWSGAPHEQLVPQAQVQVSQRQSVPQQQPEAGAVPGALGALDCGAWEQHEQLLAVLAMGPSFRLGRLVPFTLQTHTGRRHYTAERHPLAEAPSRRCFSRVPVPHDPV